MKRTIARIGIIAPLLAGLISFAYAQTPVAPAPGLIGWWTGDSNTLDLANGNNATLVGGTTYATGEVNQAFSLNGTTAFVQAPDSPMWAFGTNEFTIELWANFAASTGQRTLVANDTGGGTLNKWIFWLNSGALQFHINGPASGALFIGTAPFSPTLNQWYHLAVTRKATNYVFYINGSAVSTNINTAPVPDANAPLTIGNAEGAIFFNGRLDEVSIYNRALAGSEISAINAAGTGGKDKAMVAPVVSVLGAATNYLYLNGAITYSGQLLNPATNVTYQWLRDGVTLTNETNLTLVVPAQSLPGTFNYTLRARNDFGTNTASTLLIVRNAAGRTYTPVAQWHFDEAPGTTNAADSSTNNYTGTLAPSGAAFTNDARWGNAIALSNSWVDMGNILPGTNTDFTIVLWARTTNSGAEILLGRHNAGTANGYFLTANAQPGYGAANKASLYTSTPGSTGRDPRSSTSVTDGQWHQIVGTHRVSPAQNLIYVDGTPAESSTGADQVAANAANFLIGAVIASGVPSSSFQGVIDEVQLHQRVLSDEQIDYLYTHPSSSVTYEQDLPPNTYVWKDPVDGNWTDPQRWTPFGVPAAGDTVLITNAGNYTVIHPNGATMASLSIGGSSGAQTLRITGGTLMPTNLTLGGSGVITLLGGSLTTVGAFASAGVINQSGGSWRLLNSVALNNYNLTNGELRGSVLTVTNFNWNDGNLNADVAGNKTIIPPGGILNFLGSNERFLSYYAGQGRGIDNYGTWNWIGSGNLRGNLGAIVNNYGSVLVTATNGPNTQFNYGGSGGVAPTWNNFGLFRRAAGSTVFYLNNAYLNNSGTIEIQTGTFSIYNATATNFSSGAIFVGAGAILINENGSGTTLLTNSWLSAVDVNSVRMDSGAVYMRTTNAVLPSIWIQGGVWYQQNKIVTAQINQSSGSFQLTTPGFLQTYNLTNGELRGRDLMVMNFNWFDGNLNNGAPGEAAGPQPDRTIIPTGGVLNLYGANERFLSYHVGQGRSLENSGTWNWIGSANLRGNNGATVNNYGTVTFTATNGPNTQFNYGGSGVAPVWNNSGPFTRSAGNTFFYFNNVYLNNYDFIDIQTGSFSLNNATAVNYGAIFVANQFQIAGTTATNNGFIHVTPSKLLTIESGSSVTLNPLSELIVHTIDGVQLSSGALYVATTNFVMPSVWISGGVLYQRTNIVVSRINQSGGTLQLQVPATLAAYNLTNGELRGRDLTVTNVNWFDGNMNNGAPGEVAGPQSDRTIIPSGGVLNILGTADRFFSYHVGRGRTLDNYGTINWSAPIQLRGQNGATVNNYGSVFITGGTPNVQFDWGGTGAAPLWNNYGLLQRTVGTTTLYFDSAYLNNFGTMDIQSGTFSIYASVATNVTGIITMGAGTIFQVENGSDFAMNGPSQMSSPGLNSVRLIAGNVYASSTNLLTPSVWIQGGNWSQFTNIVVPQINQSQGTLTMRTPSAVSQYNLTNGELRGRDLTITNFNWHNGNLNNSFPGDSGTPLDRTIIPPDGIVNFFNSETRTLSYYVAPGRTFDNYGTFNWMGSAVINGQGGARFNNYGSVNITASGNAQFAYGGTGGSPFWNNYGSFTKSSGTNIFYFNGVYLNNTNSMAVNSGTLSYYNSTVTNRPGSFVQVAAGALLLSENGSETTLETGSILNAATPNSVRILAGNTYWRSADITLPSLWLAGGTLWQELNSVSEINQSGGVWRPTKPLSVTTFNMTNGELRGANISLNSFNWLGGALNAEGQGSNLVAVANTLNISSATAKSMSYYTAPGRSIIHNGAGTWGGAAITGQGGATFLNNGTMTMTNGSGLAWGGTGARAVFDNVGTFIRTGAVGTVSMPNVTNRGAFSIEIGALNLDLFTQLSGTAKLGTNLNASGTVRNEAGTLSAAGNIAGALYNNGTLNPGASPGLITAASFTNTAASTLNVELGGTAAGTNYDQIRLSSAATIGGDLKILLANNFAPQLSNRFTILTHASRSGTFANIFPPPGVILNSTYSSTNVVLEVVGLTNAPLEITQFPSNQVVWTPDPVTFTVGVSGVTPISFQWKFNGNDIAGATNTTYALPSTTPTNGGTYSVFITDGSGGTTNVSAALTVIPFNGSINWTNVAGGNWSVPKNWSPNRVPGPSHTAVIITNGTYTVTVDSAQSVSNVVVGDTNAVGIPTLYVAPGSTLTLGANALIETNAVLNLSGLMETRGGTNDVRGQIVWFTGTLLGAGKTIIRSNANVFFTGSQQAKNVVTNIIENYGSFTYSRDAGIGSGQLLQFSGGAHLTNHVGGVLNMKDNSFAYAGVEAPRSYLVNFGSIVTTSPGIFSPSYIRIEFLNYGLLDNQGYVYLFRGTNYGEMKCGNSLATISIFGDPIAIEYFSFEPSTTFTSPNLNIAAAGPVQWRAGNTIHPGSLFIAQGSGGATYPTAEFKILANYTNLGNVHIMRGSLTITNPAITTHLRSFSDGFQSFWSFGVTNAGTMYVDNFSHVIYGIGNGGDIIIRTNASFGGGNIYGSGRIVISNAATFAGGSITAQLVENYGNVSVTAGSAFNGNTRLENKADANVYFAGGSFNTGPASVINNGFLHGYGGVTFAVTNYARIAADDSLERTLTMGYLKQFAGETRLQSAVLAGIIEIDGGYIGGDYRVQGSLRNNATFGPGTPFGFLNITGGYTNTANGVEHMPIRGTQQGTHFPQVNVNGTAQLAGTLVVSFTNGFYPVVGSSFTAMTYTARSGQFEQIVTPNYDFDVQYYPNALVLRASNALPNVVISAPSTQLVCVPFMLTASATDLDGVITNIDLLFGTNVIGSFPASSGGVRVLFDFPQTVNFSARATDDRGGLKTILTNVVYVTMPLHTINLGGFATNKSEFKLCMLGETGSNYVVQAAEQFSTPVVTDWHDIGTMSFTNGIFRFWDTNATNFDLRYYRVRRTP